MPKSRTEAIWQLRSRRSEDLIQHLCALRSLDPQQLEPDFERGLHDPLLLPDMAKAVDAVEQAVNGRWRVCVFGDYDADGTPAAALLQEALTRLGLEVEVILPTRTLGYGLQQSYLADIAAKFKLLITVDTGVTAVEEIAELKKKGVAVIVLDHHLPKATLPPAEAVVDPFVKNSTYPFPNLCGCALAYKFVEALSAKYPKELPAAFRKWLLDLVAISTVGDMMIMRDENRVLVHYGLKVLRRNRRLGLRELLKVAGTDPDKVTATTIGFAIAPRLNASGRLGDNRPAFDLLTSSDIDQAAALAMELEQSNRERQGLVEQVLAEAKDQLFKQNDNNDRCFVVAKEGWPSGVVGLVAGKLSSSYRRPTIVLSENNDLLTGSGRSTERYSLIDGLESQAGLLRTFGGHRVAAGLSLYKKDLPKFVDGIKAHADKQLTAKDLLPVHLADAVLQDASELTLNTAKRVSQMGPFGLENPLPLFIIRDVTLRGRRQLGQSGAHVKFQAEAAGENFDAIGFSMNESHADVDVTKPVDCLGYLEENIWQGRSSLQLRLVDYRPSGSDIEEVE